MKKKIFAIMIGRAGSTGFPGKNILKINGKHLFEYPLTEATKTKEIDKIFVSTDCPVIIKKSKKYNVTLIKRPKNLTNKNALGEDVFQHAYLNLLKTEKIKQDEINVIVLLFANGATVNKTMISKGIRILKKNKKFDSAVSVSKYNMWSPLRARKISKKGTLVPFVPFKTFGNPKTLNCDRGSQGDVYFADMSVNVVRPRCLENMSDGMLPQKWMGKKIAPIFSNAGFDIDYEWQLPQLKYWIKKNGK